MPTKKKAAAKKVKAKAPASKKVVKKTAIETPPKPPKNP